MDEIKDNKGATNTGIVGGDNAHMHVTGQHVTVHHNGQGVADERDKRLIDKDMTIEQLIAMYEDRLATYRLENEYLKSESDKKDGLIDRLRADDALKLDALLSEQKSGVKHEVIIEALFNRVEHLTTLLEGVMLDYRDMLKITIAALCGKKD
jgi:hypothetical protein